MQSEIPEDVMKAAVVAYEEARGFDDGREYDIIARAILAECDRAALSAAEPVAELQSIDARELDEATQLLPSVMRPSLSKVIIAAIEEQRRIIAYFKRTSRARKLAFEAAITPPAPSVAVKALQMADETFRNLGWHDRYEATTAALAALSAQVQDVAEVSPAEYMRRHDAAIAAYEANTPNDYRYSALALRKAVDAAFSVAAAPVKQAGGE